jgi:hypothetical protein
VLLLHELAPDPIRIWIEVMMEDSNVGISSERKTEEEKWIIWASFFGKNNDYQAIQVNTFLALF